MNPVLAIALVLSLAGNVVLGVIVYRLQNRRRGKPLPSQKPDLARVHEELKRVLAEPEFAEIVGLKEFTAKEWICRAGLLHKVKNIGPHWEQIQRIVRRVCEGCHIPGRPAGWLPDPDDPQRMIGTTVEFGYSPEVGYNHPNELYEEFRKAKEQAEPPAQDDGAKRAAP